MIIQDGMYAMRVIANLMPWKYRQEGG